MAEQITQHTEFQLKLAALENALKAFDPNIGTLIDDIHQQIQTIPELTYILNEVQIGAIIEANSRNMKMEINTKSSPKKAIKSLLSEASADDF